MGRAIVLCSFAAVLPHSVSAGFLGSHDHHISAASLGNHMPGSDILHDLEQVVGRDHHIDTEARVNRLESTLRPMFVSMPKDGNGRLDATGVRYLLHRLFSRRHAWFVNGLSNGGDAWNSSSPTVVFENHSGEHHSVFENHLNDQGFDLHQVAVFGAALEASVHMENVKRLQAAYGALGLSQSEVVGENDSVEAMFAYMVMFVAGVEDYSIVTPQWLREMHKHFSFERPLWPATEQFVLEVRNAVLEDTPADEHNTYNTTLKVVEVIGERYGRWQNKECHMLKHVLMKVEAPGTGRVPIEDFYQDSNEFDFTETIEYLRVLGAIDDSDPERVGVIIPNYVNSLGNCIASVKHYSLCCLNECEELLGKLETNLAAPDATPARIIELVSKLPSDTVSAPRTLPATLVGRLEDIASFHGGRVPLHGRLFSQWLHHAYPRECPYPHMSGTTRGLLPEAAEELSIVVDLTEAELLEMQIKAKAKKRDQRDRPSNLNEEISLPWHHEEELFVPGFKAESGNTMQRFLRGIAFVAVLFSFASVLSRMLPAVGVKSVCSVDHKYCV